jgi:outer membrane protein OmpA-like peptidoglycan-associated protein
VAIVGHTDASGGLEANIALSRKRAQAVRNVLIEAFGVPAAQIQAEGVGYLSPRASNLTEAGRTQNRRVEVMLTSTQ